MDSSGPFGVPMRFSMNLSEISPWLEAVGGRFGFQLAACVVCGGMVGIERQLRGKAIGMRTSILICLATQVFVRLSMQLSAEAATTDPTRVIGQIVTGVGFLGAGVILARGDSITGVTSAAVVWMLAAIGSTIGAGFPQEAVLLSVLVVSILIVVRRLESAFIRLRGGSDEPENSRPMADPAAD